MEWLNRLPVELSSCLSMFPLHSAIASARLISSLSVESKSWGLVPQGLSFILSLLIFLLHLGEEVNINLFVFGLKNDYLLHFVYQEDSLTVLQLYLVG